MIHFAIPRLSGAPPVTSADFHTDRRRFLVGVAAVAASIDVGCGKMEQVVAPAAPRRKNVPLRVLLVGEAEDKDALSRGWQAVSEQAIAVEVLPLVRADSSGLGEALLERSKHADVVIYPLVLVGEASRSDVVVEMTAGEVKRIDMEVGGLLPTARNGAARYGGSTYALPLGCSLPALISQMKIQPPKSWQDYDQLVENQWEGLASEPTAPGWAGTMFLWRCSGVKNWLFERKDLTPLINTKPYVASLELMLRTNSRYTEKGLTPGQIWGLVGDGKLRGGIGFPARRAGVAVDAQLYAIPGIANLSKVVLDPFSPVVSISATCRQTSASRRFVEWLSGGEGSRAVRSQVVGMGDLRTGTSFSGNSAAYDEWLVTQLQVPLIASCPQLDDAMEYLMVLDQQVRRALSGKVASQEALDLVAQKWADLTSACGVEKQIRAWRMSQGMRA